MVAMITPTMSGPAAAFIALGSLNPETSGTVISSLGDAEADGEADGDGDADGIGVGVGELTASDW